MPLISRHAFQLDHQKTLELLARYVEIQQTAGGAELMYPDVAAHLALCETCRSALEDLITPFAAPDDRPASPRGAIMSRLAGRRPDRGPAVQPPLDLLFREEIVLRLDRAHLERLQDAPAAGYLEYYDTLSVGRLDLVLMFLLHPGSLPGCCRIEGVVSPEQPVLRLKARLAYPAGVMQAEVQANRLNFDGIPVEPAASRMGVTLEGYTRWQPGRQPARKSSGTRSGV